MIDVADLLLLCINSTASITYKHIHFGGAVQKHLMQKLYESGRFQENVSPQMMII